MIKPNRLGKKQSLTIIISLVWTAFFFYLLFGTLFYLNWGLVIVSIIVVLSGFLYALIVKKPDLDWIFRGIRDIVILFSAFGFFCWILSFLVFLWVIYPNQGGYYADVNIPMVVALFVVALSMLIFSLIVALLNKRRKCLILLALFTSMTGIGLSMYLGTVS